MSHLRSGRLAPLLAIPLVCFASNLLSCSKGGTAGGGATGTVTVGSLTLPAAEAAKVVARMGDETLTVADVAAALEHLDEFDRLRFQSPERRKELVEEMINVALLAREAKEKGYDKDPAAEEQVRAILRDAMLREARTGVPLPNEIPAGEVRAYFDAHLPDYRDPERRRLSVIVLPNEAAAKALLDTALAANTAASWGELVRGRSVDAQARAQVPADLAGDFGIVSPPGDERGKNVRVPEQVRAALFELKNVGEMYPKPIVANGQAYLIRLTAKTPPRERTFEETERTIRVKLSQDRLRAREDALLESLKKEIPVEVDEAALAKVKVNLAPAATP